MCFFLLFVGDLILEAGETFHTSPLQLHAITTRLKLPEPTCGENINLDPLKHYIVELNFHSLG